MKKLSKAISILLAVVLLFCSFGMTLTANAAEGKSGYFSYFIMGDLAIIYDCDTSASGAITVPSRINGYPVFLVRWDTFCDCTEITSVTIEQGVECLQIYMLDCTNLTYISIPTDTLVEVLYLPNSNCSEIVLNSKNTGLKFDRNKKTTTVTIGYDLVDFSSFDDYGIACENIDEIKVHSNNRNFKVVDGVLYNASVTTFYLYPTASTRKSYVMPDTVQYSEDTRHWLTYLYFAKNLESITIGKNFNLVFGTTQLYNEFYAEVAKLLDREFISIFMAMHLFDYDILECIFTFAPNLKEINVSPQHAYLTSKDGVLCLKDEKYNIILAYPGSKEGDITLNDNDMACMHAFASLQGAHKLSISDKFIDKFYDVYREAARYSGVSLNKKQLEELVVGYLDDLLAYTPVSEFCVSPTNPYLSVDEKGALYNKNKTELRKIPVRSDEKYWEFPLSVAVEMTDFLCVTIPETKSLFLEDARIHMSGLDLDNNGLPACDIVCLNVNKDDVVSFGGSQLTYEEFVKRYNTEVETSRAAYAEVKAELDMLYEQGKIGDFEYEVSCNLIFSEANMYMPLIEFCNHVPDEDAGEDDKEDYEEEYYNPRVFIKQPSRTEIRNRDCIVLHSTLGGPLPSGTYMEWKADNDNFEIEQVFGMLFVTAKDKGWTTFTATLYAEDGTELASEEVELYSKSGFFDKIGGFFRSLFGATRTYDLY